MKRLHLVMVVILLVLFMGLGWFFGRQTNTDNMDKTPLSRTISNGVAQDDSGKTVKYWYDPMVPNQKFDKPGKSPFMDMQLEPKYSCCAANNSGA